MSTKDTNSTFPPGPTGLSKAEWDDIGFRIREVNGHVESTYTKATGEWSPLRFVADPFMRIHGMAPALNYGVQAYEGLKAFRTEGDKGIVIFRPDRNAERMQHSANVVSIPPVPVELFKTAVRAAVAKNAEFVPPYAKGAAMYIRPQIYGSSAQLGLSPPEDYTFCVFVMPTGVYHGNGPAKALILDDFDRAAPNGVGNAKVGGNYGPVLRWSDKARAEGFGITLHLDSANHEDIDEFSTSGFIGVMDDGEKVTLVVPDSKCVIDSITSKSVEDIARHLFKWEVQRRAIKYHELPKFAEVMAAGTAAALVPIQSITRRKTTGLLSGERVSTDEGGETVVYIQGQEPGEKFRLLYKTLKNIQQGKAKDIEWLIKDDEGEKGTGKGIERWLNKDDEDVKKWLEGVNANWVVKVEASDLSIDGEEPKGTAVESVGQMA